MNLKHLILFISALVISCNGEFEDFCTLSGMVKGLDKNMNFNEIFVKLFNKQGNLKEKTEVSETGFFVLPIYDKGDYTIRVSAPAGYSFHPEEISFNFDGVNDICSQKKDVNFSFKGFGITGKVNVVNEVAGAKGVLVTLFNDKNNKITSAVTDDAGVFTFSPIVPGSYKVVASHDSWHFSKSEHSVKVSTGNTELPAESLLVSGFNLNGRMNQPPAKIGFLIYGAKNSKNQQKCDEKPPQIPQSISSDFQTQPICYTSQIKNGEFVFKNLPSGRYLIIPFLDQNDIELHISPESIQTEINRNNQQLTESFEVSGFSATGRVLLSQNTPKGIKDATVKVNGQIVTKTDAAGIYTLKNIKDGNFKIQISAADLEFNDETVKISMSSPRVPDIFVSGFKVCGKVVSDQSYKVAIKKHGSTFFTQVNSDPKDGGTFCTFLGNGKYSIEVLIDENDRKNVQFYPIQHQIEVNSEAVNDLIFSQLRAEIVGEVTCLPDEPCNVEVTLSSLDETGYSRSFWIYDRNYRFKKILPGRYQLFVSSDSICWQQEKQIIDVKSEVENVPKFVQSGFKLAPIISSHDTQGSYKLRQEGSKSVDVKLTSGANVICVPKAGTYDLKVTGCHKFEEDSKTLMTKSSTPVHVNAVKHQNGIRILSEISQKFTIEAEFEDGVKILKPVEQREKVDGYVAYNINLDLKAGERVKLTPKSEQMLFKPDQTELKGAIDCVDVAFNFIATKGLVVTGKTDPVIADVVVTLTFPKNPEVSAMITATNSAGEFKFPTIDPTIDYEIRAEKESYIFSDFDSGRNLFHGHKLCEIIVEVKDESAKELANVVISLSGGENYRKNLATAANGEIKFHSLKPGKYYLRAMMKEYDFKPNSQTLEIKDGETVRVQLSGKRVAYSVFGKITTLSGDAFANVNVEAVSVTEACSNHQEEAVTESNGQYRIRGLQTGCDYKIRLQKTANVDRSIPTDRNVAVKVADTENVNFIAVNPINLCDVIVKVKSKTNDHYKTLKIQMYKKDSPDTPFYSQRIENLMMPKSKQNDNIMVFMPRINANDFGKVFFIEFTTTLSDKNYNFKLPSIQFTANTTSHYFEVEFNPQLKQPDTELNKNSVVALLLIFIVGFVFLKQELVFETAVNLWTRFNSEVAAGKQPAKKSENRSDNFIDEKEINKLAEFIEERKKKKPKKNN